MVAEAAPGGTGHAAGRRGGLALIAAGVVLYAAAGLFLSRWQGRGLWANRDIVAVWFYDHDPWIKLPLCLLCTVLVLWPDRRPEPRREAPLRLKLAAGLALLAYYNFGGLHGRNFVHYWDQFHYLLGSKYFAELGYDGLYAASAAGQLQTMKLDLQPHIRDLRNNQVAAVSQLEDHLQEVKGRFSLERWAQFTEDQFALSPAIRTPSVRMDHGYNPTPAWTFMARLFSAWLPGKHGTLVYNGLLDQALLLGMWVVLFRTYGAYTGCLAMTVFGLNYASRFYWNGGGLLRFDWLVAAVLGVCLLRRDRPFAAGAAFGYATMVRVFPVLFLAGPAVAALRGLRRRQGLRFPLRLAAGFAVSAAVLGGLGCLAGRGPQGWAEFGRNLEKHRNSWLNNNVGLETLVLYGRITYGRALVEFGQPEPWLGWQHHLTKLREKRRLLTLACMVVSLALVAAAAWRSRPDQAAALGPLVAFSVLLLTCYYWAMLLLLPIRGGRRVTAYLLLMSAGLFGLDWMGKPFETIYGVMSWLLAALLAGWLAPAALSGLRRRAVAVGPSEPPA